MDVTSRAGKMQPFSGCISNRSPSFHTCRISPQQFIHGMQPPTRLPPHPQPLSDQWRYDSVNRVMRPSPSATALRTPPA